MTIEKPQLQAPMLEGSVKDKVSAAWASFFNSIYRQAVRSQAGMEGSGTTANRPTAGLWVGRVYFDTTLGKPVFVKSLSPVVWVDAAGSTV